MNEQTLASDAPSRVSRRRFLGYAGALAGAGLLAGTVGCTKKEEDPFEGAISLGASDFGVLNLVYAISQVQAAFYGQVLLTPYTPLKTTDLEYKTIDDMRKHEIAHRELLRKLLGTNAIQDLTPDFSTVFFIKRTSVLDTAKFLEDLSVSAYNGAAKLLDTDAFLDVFAKIASVEARHSAAIRDLILMGSFADDSFAGGGQDYARDPGDVVMLLNAYIKERINPTNLPSTA